MLTAQIRARWLGWFPSHWRLCDLSFSRLLKKAHLLRWSAWTLVAAYEEYASLGPARPALHLDLFEQPGENEFSATCRMLLHLQSCVGAGRKGLTPLRTSLI